MHTFVLVVGDWSHDGHNLSDNFEVECSHTLEETKAAFERGVRILGFNIMEQCEDYEDNALSEEHLAKLAECGFEAVPEEDWVYPKLFAEIVMFTAQLGEHELDWNFAKGKSLWNVGGYGLFT